MRPRNIKRRNDSERMLAFHVKRDHNTVIDNGKADMLAFTEQQATAFSHECEAGDLWTQVMVRAPGASTLPPVTVWMGSRRVGSLAPLASTRNPAEIREFATVEAAMNVLRRVLAGVENAEQTHHTVELSFR